MKAQLAPTKSNSTTLDAQLPRVYLSPPHMSASEKQLLIEAFDSNWIAPLGPMVDAFEDAVCDYTGAQYAVALSSGTAALHLALIEAGVTSGDDVFVSTLTFSASVNPICYLNANPIFIDSAPNSFNIDVDLLEEALQTQASIGRIPKALILVHLYGHSADMDRIVPLCEKYGVTLIEDSAESLGTFYKGQHTGTFGKTGIFSFNGNKIITTSGGGMLVSDDGDLIAHARKLATQARDIAPHYQHSELGYNYRLSNLAAAVGVGQMQAIEDRVAARRFNNAFYQESLGHLPGIKIWRESDFDRANHWLSVMTVDPAHFGVDHNAIRLTLEANNIESRPVWKPMHLQPVFANCQKYGGQVSTELFGSGLCLPSGSSLSEANLARIVSIIRSCHRA